MLHCINMLATAGTETIALYGSVNGHASHECGALHGLRPVDIVRQAPNIFTTIVFSQCFEHNSLTVEKVLHRCCSEVPR
jgi:hypothetical protein